MVHKIELKKIETQTTKAIWTWIAAMWVNKMNVA
jgi:hypothetical protein